VFFNIGKTFKYLEQQLIGIGQVAKT